MLDLRFRGGICSYKSTLHFPTIKMQIGKNKANSKQKTLAKMGVP